MDYNSLVKLLVNKMRHRVSTACQLLPELDSYHASKLFRQLHTHATETDKIHETARCQRLGSIYSYATFFVVNNLILFLLSEMLPIVIK